MSLGKCNRRLSHPPKVMGTKCMFLNEMKLLMLPSRVGGCLFCLALFTALPLPMG